MNDMKIKVGKVEGQSGKIGSKQNRIYTILSISSNENFHNAIDENGYSFTIWNVHGDWSEVGIACDGRGMRRFSYTKDFEII